MIQLIEECMSNGQWMSNVIEQGKKSASTAGRDRIAWPFVRPERGHLGFHLVLGRTPSLTAPRTLCRSRPGARGDDVRAWNKFLNCVRPAALFLLFGS